jgi:sulfate transport system ATP-binding protein
VVRVIAAVAGTETELTIELPHLHHDVPQFQAGANLRLRLLLFSVFLRAKKPAPGGVVTAPLLIGRERARA